MMAGTRPSGFNRTVHAFGSTHMTKPRRSQTLQSRLQAVHAAGRVDDSLLAIALDALEPFASDYLSGDDYLRLCQELREPVEHARDAALSSLIDSLARQPADGDPELATHRESIRRRSL
jgi:hypothetical protein